MKKRSAYFLISFLAFAFLAFLFPRFSLAAKFSLDPATEEIELGEEFQVDVSLNTQGKAVNGVQAKLSFPPAQLELVRVDFTGIFPSNFQQIKNASGYVQLASGEDLPSANFNGHLEWLTLTFKTKVVGASELRFVCLDSAILEYETTSNLLDCGSLNVGGYTITAESEPTSTPTSDDDNGDDGDNDGGGNGDDGGDGGCSDASPAVPSGLQASGGPSSGEVTLAWNKVDGADHYSLVFGSGSRQYQYGAADIGNVGRYVVKQLSPGQLYYFAVAAVEGCASSGFSSEVSARAKSVVGSGSATPTVGRDVSRPTPTLAYQPIGQVLPNVDFDDLYEPTPTPFLELEEDDQGSKILSAKNIILLMVIILVLIGVFLFVKMLFKKRSPPKGPVRYVDLSKPDSASVPPPPVPGEV